MITTEQATGLLVIGAILLAAIFLAVWLRGRKERQQTTVRTTVELDDFTAAVWAAQCAAAELQTAVLTGNTDTLYRALERAHETGYNLAVQLEAREEKARQKAYDDMNPAC